VRDELYGIDVDKGAKYDVHGFVQVNLIVANVYMNMLVAICYVTG